ncbi:endonuclease [Mycobacterium sp. SMC-8]|uniref:endonuclease n=1 Tax=Mycobacterium sp. SMC-8 TaxID=2857060 RepID=UPI0021B26B60|nr:endonuclease [Mycobacterium sp. SMC-8]UXA10924.1 endonuclease [Mycobacterium sp. SMC-8]
MATSAQEQLVERLLGRAGTTYAEEAGIRLRDKPMPLFQLLLLCMLASKPIDAAIATRAAREMFRAGLRTPRAVRDAERSALIHAFGRARYVRYDESSATRAVDIATMIDQDYAGDLRRMAVAAGRDPDKTKHLLTRFKGIGDTGADIFLREIQDTWTWVRPYFDDRAVTAAAALGLPRDPDRLAALAPRRAANLAAALVRVSLDGELRDELR